LSGKGFNCSKTIIFFLVLINGWQMERVHWAITATVGAIRPWAKDFMLVRKRNLVPEILAL